ncbi:MAG: M20 metallopeptidase family protein [Candidatus Hodarchaeales archaeon]|jgi:amidohydrolase
MNAKLLKKTLINEAKNLESHIIAIRRYLHMNPEIAFEETNTAKYIEEELNSIGLSTQRTVGTGVITTIKSEKKGKTIALRADIDALNIMEENVVDYKSKIPNRMHACGHDAHTAMLLGAAKIIFKYKDHLRGNIKLVFQPGEEGGGGGKKIVEEGHFRDVDTVFGIHVWRDLPSGIIATRKGAALASSDKFTITIIGKGGHVATPHQTIDPVSVLTDIYNALQKIVSREIDPFEPRLLAVPIIEGSKAFNVIPPKATLQGTFRTLNTEVREFIIKRIKEIVEGYSNAWRCKGTVEFRSIAYPPVINDEETVEKITIMLSELDEVKIMNQSMIGEDFAFYLQETKGALLTLGIFNEDKGIIFPHHHPRFQIDESVLWKGAAVYSILGFYFLFSET